MALQLWRNCAQEFCPEKIHRLQLGLNAQTLSLKASTLHETTEAKLIIYPGIVKQKLYYKR